MREWFAFYPGDYLRDTMGFSVAEHGAYLRLLMAYWSNGGPIPDDPKWLALACGVSVKHWLSLSRRVLDKFSRGDGLLRQKRLQNQLDEWSRQRERAAYARSISSRSPESRVQSSKDSTRNSTTTKPESESSSSSPALPRSRARTQIGTFIPNELDATRFWNEKGIEHLQSGDQARQFIDHHKARGSTMADWPAAWRTWYRNAIKFEKGPQRERTKSNLGNHLEGLRQLAEERRRS